MVNAVVDERLSSTNSVNFSYDSGSTYSEIVTVSDPFDNSTGHYATTVILSYIDGKTLTNIRFVMGNLGSYPASFSEIDVVGVAAVPEPSQAMMILGAACIPVLIRRRAKQQNS